GQPGQPSASPALRDRRLPFFRHALRRRGLDEQSFDHLAADIGEAIIAALETVGKASVVDAQTGEHGGAELVNADGVFGHIVTEIIGRAINHAWFGPATRPPAAETSL